MANRQYTVSAVVDQNKLQKSAQVALTSQTIKIPVDVQAKGITDLKVANTTMSKLTDGAGNTRVEIDKFNASGEKLGTTIKNTSKNVKSLGQDFTETFGKVLKFGMVTAIIGLMTSSISEAVKSAKDLDDSLIELQKVSSEAKDNLSGFTDQAFELAEAMSTSASNVTDAVTEFSKSGYGLQDSLQLAEQAMVFQTIADDAISASDSATMLIQTMKAYNLTASDSEHIINALNEVSNNYAVSSTDLSQSIGKVASVANLAGVDFEHLLGLMTASTEVTQNASKSANGYKTILTNLMTKDLEKQFNEFGLSMRDTNGALKDGYQIIEELSSVYKKLGTVWSEDDDAMVSMNDNFNALMEDISGKHNINVLVAGLQNFDQAINATESALNSAGSAQEEFDTAMGGLTKKLEGLKGQFQELVWGDGGLNNFLKGLVDLGTVILKFASSDLGQVITRMGVLVVTITLAQKAFALLNATMIASVAGVSKEVAMIAVANGATIGLSGAINVLTASIMANPLLWGSVAIVGAVGAVTAIIKNYKTEQEKLSEQHEESIKQAKEKIQLYDEEKQKLESLTSQYESNISKINELKNSGNTENNSILESYELQNGALEKQIEYQKTLLGLTNEKAEKKAVGALGEKTQKGYTSSGEEGYVTDAEKIRQNTESIKKFQEAIEDYQIVLNGQQLPTDKVEIYQKSIDNLNKQISDGIIAEDEFVKIRKQGWQGLVDGTLTIEQYNDATKTTQDSIKRLIEENSSLIPNVETLNNSIYSTSGANKELKDSNQKIIDSAKEVIGAFGTSSGIVGAFASETLDLEKKTNQATEALQAYKDALSELSSMGKSFTTLNDAISEYNSSGEFTLDTLDNLLALGDDYLSLLQFENGQLTLNKDGALALANAKIDDAEASAIQSAQADIAAMSENDLGDAMANTSAQASASVSGLTSAQQAITNLGLKADTSSLKMQNLYQSLGGKGNLVDGSNAEERTKALANEIKTLESMRSNLGKITTATKSYTSATKDNTDALKEQKEALEKEISVYESAISYINSKLDDEIDKLEDLKDVALDSIDAQIDVLKEQKDAEEQFWNDKINALNKQNDALEDQLKYEQLLANLAKAQSTKVKVYKEGQGFVYDVDQSAVNSAKKELEDYKRKKALADQVKELEQNRDSKLKIYDKQIADLKRYKDRISQNYDAQIQYYKDYKSNFKNMVDSYDIEQNRLQALQLTGIDFENNGWQTRLKNLDSFASEYTKKLQTLKTMTEEYNKASSATTKSSGSGVSGIGSSLKSPTSQPKSKNYYVYQTLDSFDSKIKASSKMGVLNGDGIIQVGNKYLVIKWKSGGYSTMGEASSNISNYNGNGVYKRYYSGADSIDSNQIALVGDSPNNELVIGSKLNGQMMNLSKGSGVVNAKSTNTLAGILNSLGSINQPLSENSSLSQGFSISIGNLSLPNVQNPTDFVKGIKELAIQKAYSLV